MKKFKVNIVKKVQIVPQAAPLSNNTQKNLESSLASLNVKVRKPSLDKVVQLAAAQKERIDKTLNNT